MLTINLCKVNQRGGMHVLLAYSKKFVMPAEDAMVIPHFGKSVGIIAVFLQ